MTRTSSRSRWAAVLWLIFFGLQMAGGGCGDSNNQKDSITSGTTTGGGGSGGAPAAISVSAGNSQLAAGGSSTTVTVIVTDARGARTDATFYLTSSLGGNFIVNNESKGGTIVGTTTNGIFITTFESGSVLETTEIAAFIPGTTIRGTTSINIV